MSTLTIPLNLPTPLPDTLRDSIFAALVSDTESIPTIWRTLSSALDASGWIQKLNNRILELLRTGQYASYDEILDQLAMESGRPTSGTRESTGARHLLIPTQAIEDGIKAVKAELEKADLRVEEDD